MVTLLVYVFVCMKGVWYSIAEEFWTWKLLRWLISLIKINTWRYAMVLKGRVDVTTGLITSNTTVSLCSGVERFKGPCEVDIFRFQRLSMPLISNSKHVWNYSLASSILEVFKGVCVLFNPNFSLIGGSQ